MIIREIKADDFQEFAILHHNAYPGFPISQQQMIEALEKSLERDDVQTLVAVADNGQVVGGLKLYDFTIYQNYNELKMAGIGGVCVGLDAKKQGVAKNLILDSLKRMQDRDIPVSILYPFRHDFYQKMGWGQVGELKEFKFAPAYLQLYPERKNVRTYREGDLDGIKKCYTKFARAGNCLVKRTDTHWQRKLINKNIFVYEEAGEIQGYMQIGFEKNDSFLDNNMIIHEMIYLTQKAYFGLLGFIASQFDQISSVYYYTKRNDPFHHLLSEPRRENILFNQLYHYSQRLGISWMFRVINIEKALLSRQNYNAANLSVTFIINDSFLPDNSDRYTLILKDGKPEVIKDKASSYHIKTDISTFSQIFANYLSLNDAIQLGKINVSDPAIVSPLMQALSLSEPYMLEFF